MCFLIPKPLSQQVEEAGQKVEQATSNIARYDLAIEKCKVCRINEENAWRLTFSSPIQSALVELSAEAKQRLEEVNQFSEILKKANEELAQAKEEITVIVNEFNKGKVFKEPASRNPPLCSHRSTG